MPEKLIRFIEESPTPFHAVRALRALLEEAGFCARSGRMEPGGRYYSEIHGSALIAWKIPEGTPRGLMIAAAHDDAPCFLLRENPVTENGGYRRFSAEPYGSMINESWFDRPLGIAGRVTLRTGDGVRSTLIDFKRDMAMIPRLAIHMNREVNNGVKTDPARDLVPLWGLGEERGAFAALLAAEAGCAPEDLIASDLLLYNREPGVLWGAENAFLSAPRLDDLAGVFACANGFLRAKNTAAVQMLCVFNNEEIGSGTKQGAASAALPSLIAAITRETGADERELLENALMLSCDGAHARHPNHPELADAVLAPVAGGGVVIKHSPRYATDGIADALFREICRKAGVPTQHYANRPDMKGGSTLGNIAAAGTPVETVDIGIAQFAMHSAYETLAAADIRAMEDAVAAVLGTVIRKEDERYIIEGVL